MPRSASAALFVGIALAAVLVILVVVLVLLSNPPNKWVDRVTKDKEK
ncbi:MAG TPA: hypothetical protein VFL57_21485 [Bryobacteraceae bacterium]|nr:hypothetical protein [Bryobacteraceae bacterium]